jgi:WD40 repeat protein
MQRVGVMSLEVTGEKLISGGDDSMIRIWNTNNWTCEQILRAHQVLRAANLLSFLVFWSHTAWLAVTKC